MVKLPTSAVTSFKLDAWECIHVSIVETMQKTPKSSWPRQVIFFQVHTACLKQLQISLLSRKARQAPFCGATRHYNHVYAEDRMWEESSTSLVHSYDLDIRVFVPLFNNYRVTDDSAKDICKRNHVVCDEDANLKTNRSMHKP